MLTLQHANTLVHGTEFEGGLSVIDDAVYLRYDLDDCTAKEQWDEYVDVVDRLKTLGLQFVEEPDNVCVEHDCITGTIELINPTPTLSQQMIDLDNSDLFEKALAEAEKLGYDLDGDVNDMGEVLVQGESIGDHLIKQGKKLFKPSKIRGTGVTRKHTSADERRKKRKAAKKARRN